MALPKQVQKQLDEVEEFEKQLEAQKDESKKKPSKKKAPELEIVPEDTKGEEETKQPEAKSEKKEAKPADVEPEVGSDEFKQKYNTLRGKYDAEVPRLHQQVKELTDQLTSLKTEIEATKKAESEKPKEEVSYITDADREEYGDDLIEFQRRVAKDVAKSYDDKLEAQESEIAKLREQINATGSQVGEMSFSQKLNHLVPDFDTLDNDERWASWLNEYDPMIRGPRRDQAQAAFDSGDADAVAHYVKLFRESITPKEEVRDDRQAELEKQVSPNRSANSTVTKSAGRDAKIYSEKEIEKAWGKIRTMNSAGKYDDAAKLEAELTAAYVEGRVRS